MLTERQTINALEFSAALCQRGKSNRSIPRSPVNESFVESRRRTFLPYLCLLYRDDGTRNFLEFQRNERDVKDGRAKNGSDGPWKYENSGYKSNDGTTRCILPDKSVLGFDEQPANFEHLGNCEPRINAPLGYFAVARKTLSFDFR